MFRPKVKVTRPRNLECPTRFLKHSSFEVQWRTVHINSQCFSLCTGQQDYAFMVFCFMKRFVYDQYYFVKFMVIEEYK